MASALKPILAVLLLCIAGIPMQTSAIDVGGIQASESTVALMPANPVAGGSVTISLTLFNSGNYASDVEYAFYRESVGPSRLLDSSTVDIDADSSQEVSAVWQGLVEGEHEVHIQVEYPRDSGQIDSFYVPFNVTGLPNLKVTETALSPSSGIHSGDSVTLSSLVRNVGTETAVASTLHVDLPGSEDQDLQTPEIMAGQTQWVNTTFTAPDSGSYAIFLTPDYQDTVIEESEMNKVLEVALVVETRMDVYHLGDLLVEIEDGELEGPWMVSGRLARTNGSGTTDVPIWLQIPTDTGGLVTTAPFTVTMTGMGYAEKDWSHTLTSSELSSLSAGVHTITAKIDPFGTAPFIQESTENDQVSTQLSIFEIPDVFVDPIAISSSPSVNSGAQVEWRITMTNIGDIEVSGKLHYTWEGVESQSPMIYLDAGQDLTWTVDLTTAIGAHDAVFDAAWVPSSNSWDSNPLNSQTSGTVVVEADLRLSWALSTLDVTDLNGETAVLPMTQGEMYSIAIDLTSVETGSLTFDCINGEGEILSTLDANVSNRGDKVLLECQFTAISPSSVVRLVPSDATVTSTFTRTFATVLSDEELDDLKESSTGVGTFTLMGFGVLILIGMLVGAVLLTRDRDEEVERDIFEYCPACDGELEGDEDRCPHCSFNLKKARKQFHDCDECGESIPDLLDNCVYCGADQDVSSYFEQRQRREVAAKEVVALVVEENEDEIVTGTENFAQTVQEFGYDEDQLEEEWDKNIVSAEAEVEAAYDRRNADDILRENMTEEELEEYDNSVTTTLKSTKEMGEKANDIDSILASKGEIIAHKDDGKDLSASDADIRGRLFEITGEDGVMPGEKVNVGMQLTDSAFAGNEVSETTADFTMGDDEKPVSINDELTPNAVKPARRRSARRKKDADEPKRDVAECGACGADLAVDATECGTCGAKFE